MTLNINDENYFHFRIHTFSSHFETFFSLLGQNDSINASIDIKVKRYYFET